MVLLVCAFLFASSGAAFAYFSVSGSGNASAKATTLGAGNQPSATVSGRDVTLSWSAFTNATSYTVARSNVSPQSLSTTLNGTCAGNPTGTSCTDTGVVENGTAATNWTYTDTPNVHNWIGGASPASATVTVPGPTLSVGSTSVTSAGGTANTVTVAHYFDNEVVTYCVDNDTTSCPVADQTSPTTATVPATGGTVTTTTLTLPAGLTGGSHTLYAKGSSGSDPTGVSFNVAKVTPTITTAASPSSITVGGSVDDQATVSGGYNPTGTITWSLYASTDTTCSGTVFFTTSSGGTVSGDNTYTSGSFTTTAANSYKWGFSYNGDSHNNPVSACGGTNESLTVNKATPSLSTNATASVSVGGTVTDTATLANGYNPTGTITYTLYGPSPTQSCTSQVGQVTSSVNSGNNTYTSPTITPPSAGTYWWIANYGGDANNAATTNGCGQSGESSVVTKVTPIITTNASPASVTVGGSVADQATVSGGFSPTGTITWKLYASTDTTCSGTVFFTSTAQTVAGNALYTSSSFTTNAVGTYKWGFSYTGDTNNNPVSACGGTNETLTVNKASPTIATALSASSIAVGQTASDSSSFTGLVDSTGLGTVAYSYWTNNTCTTGQVAVNTVTVPVSGSVPNSNAVTFNSAGTFYWQAVYSGDANNNGASSPCTAVTNEQLTVVAPPTISKSFGAASIALNASTSMTITVTNPNAATTLTGVGYSDTMPAGLVVATPNGQSGTCVGNGTISDTAGSGTVSLTGASLAAGANCTLIVNVTGTTSGSKTNTTSAVTSTQGGTGTTASASINVYAANGSGTMTVSPNAALKSSTGNTLTFTYTAGTGGTSNGEVDVAVPAGWAAPTASNAVGCTTVSGGTLAFSGQTIKVTALTLAANATLTVTYGAKSGGSCTASDGVTAPATTGVNTFTTSENSTGGTVVAITSSPTVTVGQALPLSTSTPGTYYVYVPSGHAVTLTNICGGAGGGGATSSGGTGGGGGCVAGAIPSQASAYSLTVIVAAGGQSGSAGSAGGTGLNVGGAGGTTTTNGAGGGGSSALQVNGVNVVIAAGGGGGSGQSAGSGGAGGTTSPGSGSSGSGSTGGGGGGTGNLTPGDGVAGTAGSKGVGGGGGGAGANPGDGGSGRTNNGSSSNGGGAGGDLVLGSGSLAPTGIGYSAGGTTAANTTGANGSVSLS
jgi:hypothetical protein